MSIKVGIVGAGSMGWTHAEVLARDPRVEIAGVADSDLSRAEKLAGRLRARAFQESRALFDSGISTVFITAPNFTHAPLAIEALARNLNVFSEKPMGITLEESAAVRDAAANSKHLYQIGFNRRYAPVYRLAREAVQTGFTPYLANIKMHEGDLKSPGWVSDASLTGGFLYENTLHFFDLVEWLMGEIRTVYCRAASHCYENDLDDFAIVFGLDSGKSAAITCTGHASWAFPAERMELVGDHEAIITHELEQFILARDNDRPTERRDFFRLSKSEKWGYDAQDRAFIDSIEAGGPSAFSADRGYRIAEIIEACYDSSKAGAVITLSRQPAEKNG